MVIAVAADLDSFTRTARAASKEQPVPGGSTQTSSSPPKPALTKSAATGVLGRPPPAPSSSPPAPLLRGRASPLTLVSTGGGGLVSPMMGGGSRSSLGSLAEIPAPSSKPPSTYHDYSGSTQIQDIFLARFEGQKGRGDGRSPVTITRPMPGFSLVSAAFSSRAD